MFGLVDFAASVGERDRSVLEFAAVVPAVLATHVETLFGCSSGDAQELLVSLRAPGLLARDVVGVGEPYLFRITEAGLRAIQSRSAPPGFEARYELGTRLGWVWIAAQRGWFGEAASFVWAAQMRAQDRVGGREAPFGLALEEFGGSPEIHYPDLLAFGAAGRTAYEFLLAIPSLRQLDAALRAYAADARIERVLFLIADRGLGRVVRAHAVSLGLSRMVFFQPIEFTDRQPSHPPPDEGE